MTITTDTSPAVEAKDPGFTLEDPEVTRLKSLLEAREGDVSRAAAERDAAKQRLAEQEQLTQVALNERDAAMRGLEQFKELVVEVGGRAADDHDWCSTYDEIMAELGLPGRERGHIVTVSVSFRINVTVMARSQEEAEEIVGDASPTRNWRPSTMLNGLSVDPYSVTDLEFELSE